MASSEADVPVAAEAAVVVDGGESNEGSGEAVGSAQEAGEAAAAGGVRAAVMDRYGGAEVLRVEEHWAVPEPSPTSVVVAVAAASVNPVDWKVRNGMLPFPLPAFPLVVGRDFAGTVVACGERVTRCAVGDRVFGMVSVFQQGSTAERIAVDESQLAQAPASLPLSDAAALPLVSLTAWIGLKEKAKVQPRDRVLVLGGSGGVGSVAVQLAKHAFDCDVIATCSTSNVEMVKGLGADRVIDYTAANFWEDQELLGSCACVIDCAGNYSSQSFPVLRRGGTFVSLLADDMHSLWSKVSFVGSLVFDKLVQWMWHQKYYEVVSVEPKGVMLEEIAAAVDAGSLRVLVDSRYPLDRIREAHERSQTKRARGKILVVMDAAEADAPEAEAAEAAVGGEQSGATSSAGPAGGAGEGVGGDDGAPAQ